MHLFFLHFGQRGFLGGKTLLDLHYIKSHGPVEPIRVLRQRRRFTKKISLLDNESSELAMVRRAELLINFGDADKGANILRKILDDNPGNIKANLISGNMYLKLQLYSMAIEHVQNVLKKNRKQIHARIILSKSFIG